MQPDVGGERAAAAVAGGPAGAEQAERRGAAAGEGEAAAGAGGPVSREDTDGGGGTVWRPAVFPLKRVKGPPVLLVSASLFFSQLPGKAGYLPFLYLKCSYVRNVEDQKTVCIVKAFITCDQSTFPIK